MKREQIVIISLILVLIISGCSSVPLSGQQMDYEERQAQEKENTAFLARTILSFVGLVGGGTLGLLSGDEENKIAASVGAGLLGGAVGFGIGFLVGENIKKTESEPEKPADKEIDKYFDEYQNIKLMK